MQTHDHTDDIRQCQLISTTHSMETILAIDCNNVNLVMLKAMLNGQYSVHTLQTPAQAVQTAMEIQPSLILLDTYMPGKDIRAICREIKKNTQTASIPIIIASADTDITGGLEAGADDYITKPYNARELKLRIRKRIDTSAGKLTQKIRSQEREIASYYKYSANGIITVSEALEIRRCNMRFLEMFGINSRNSHTGQKLSDLIKGEPMREIEQLTAKVGKPPIFETAHIKLNKPGESATFIDATASRLSASDNSGFMLVFTDVTKLRNIDSAILSATVEAEERERKNIAQELHDGIGATLSSINIYMNMILSGGADADEIFKNIRLTKELVAQSIDEVKEIANNLHPVILTRFGLIATISNTLEELEQSRITEFVFDHSKYTDISNKNLELAMYRIINELITNTLKYAEARNVTITLERGPGNIWLQYTDNGKGFDPAGGQGQGISLSNIFGRVKGFDGICNLQSSPGRGMSVEIEFPYAEPGYPGK